MLLTDRLHGFIGKLISWLLIITTQGMTAHIAYSQDEFSQVVQDANVFTDRLLSQRAVPSIDSSGNLSSGGQVIFSQKELTGQRDTDYLPAGTDTYGNDSATLIQGQAAQSRYESMNYEDATTSGERAYHIINRSFSQQKPDLSNDPMWNNTDNVFENIEDIAKGFAECRVSKELVSTGEQMHVPVYKTCDRLPAIEETFYIGHEYEVGVIKHADGPLNLQSCGDGCMSVWIGTVGNNYWGGSCTIYEEKMSLELIQPNKILSATLVRSKFDDYHQVYVNDTKVYNGPNSNFPPETAGACELEKSWDTRPNVDVTNHFQSVPQGGELAFKTRTSVSGSGEGYSQITVYYDHNSLIYNELWDNDEAITKAYQVKEQAEDGFCEASITCTNSPTLDASGCTEINGVRVCESDFSDNPLEGLGISPFCKTVTVESNCSFNEGELCWTDMNGNETCFENDTQSRNTCEQYEQDPTCSYVKTECVEGAEGASGECYVQEDTFDCGFTVNNGTTAEEDVVICDGQIQCIGESCYSPNRDMHNDDFGKTNAYLEMLKFAKNDMACEGVPEAPYDPDTPPDQYIPVPSCETGYQYNTDSQQCLKQITCDYSDNDFYAASPRDGIQVVKNSSVLVENDSIPVCVPVSNNGQTFTCGSAMKKLSTDTFYEVCTNEVGTVIPKGCPNSEHELDPVSGFCEIPPISTCPVGFDLHEGSDIWSVEDDFCRLETPVTYNCDVSHEDYNPDTGFCEGGLYEDATCEAGFELKNGQCQKYTSSSAVCSSGAILEDGQCKQVKIPTEVCPSGYERNGSICEKINYTDLQYSCPSNSILDMFGYVNPMCVKNETQCKYTSDSYVSERRGTKCFGKTTTSANETKALWNGASISSYIKGSYKNSNEYSGYCGGGDGDSYSYTLTKYEICKSVKVTSEAQSYCPNGYEPTDVGSCYQVADTMPVIKQCPSGFSYDASRNKCVENIGNTPICPVGQSYNQSKNICEKTDLHTPICQAGYTYNIKTNQCELFTSTEPRLSCETEGTAYHASTNTCRLDVDATVTCPNSYPVWNESEQRCMSEPIGVPSIPSGTTAMAAFSSKMPTNVRSEQPEDDEPTTQASMMRYIDKQVNNMLVDVIENQEAYEVGQKMLFGAAAAQPMSAMSSTPTGNVRSLRTTRNAPGQQNVTCELFKGDAKECKIAVGGMQNCCESPVATTLGDYIALTKSVMMMDGIVAEAGMIDGYNGAWSYVEAGGDAAWDAVSSLWSSGADTATQEVANTGMMEAFQQSVMSYTNDFLIETFGKEVASMFFTTATNEAGAQVVAASAEMAAVGQALMYVYYAYLAYVVFNLLVGIIYECEEEEMDLAMKVELLSTHYIGSYCKDRVLGACIEKRKVYCTFDSPLSRIVMEEVYKQPHMGLSWGSTSNPNCHGLSLEDINKVDWDQVNLDEWTAILLETGNMISQEDINIDLLTGAGSALNTSEDNPRQNVLEQTEERLDSIDIDAAKREAYEDAWNKYQ